MVKNKPELMLIGGQAVIEGVLMRSGDKASVAVRRENGKVIIKNWNLSTLSSRLKPFKLPFIRGIGVLYDTLGLGFKALSFSAKVASGESESESMGRKEIAISLVAAVVFSILLFLVAPLFLAHTLARGSSLLFNILDGIFRLVVFLGYLVLISFFKDIRRIFEYHGAEHMTIHAYEKGEKLIPLKIRKYPTMHPRCGTSFLLIVILLSILVFSFVNPHSLVLKFVSRLLLIPAIAGVSYEILRLGARFEKNIIMKFLVAPGILLQFITTKEPDERQILVAIASLKSVIGKN